MGKINDPIKIRAYDQWKDPLDLFGDDTNVSRIHYISFETERDRERYKAFLEGHGWAAEPDYGWLSLIPPKEGVWMYNPDIASAYDGPWRPLNVKNLDEYILDMKALEESEVVDYGEEDG